MAAHVESLAHDATARARFSAQARTSVEERTWEKVCEALMSHYADAISDEDTRPSRPWDAREAVA